jgi:hypothetical protein
MEERNAELVEVAGKARHSVALGHLVNLAWLWDDLEIDLAEYCIVDGASLDAVEWVGEVERNYSCYGVATWASRAKNRSANTSIMVSRKK